jgi:hypothetical protein
MADLRILRDLGHTPDLATELGHMCVAWAALEFRMFCLFNRLSDLPVALARASFYSHRSTRDRGDLILTTAKMVLWGSQKREACLHHSCKASSERKPNCQQAECLHS